MDDERVLKKALLRYQIISPFLAADPPRGQKYRLIEELASRQWVLEEGTLVSPQPETIRYWLRQYRTGGFEALKDKPRKTEGPAKEYASVGPRRTKGVLRINDAAGSSDTHGGKSVKARQRVTFPGRTQVKANLPPQTPQPLSLVGPLQVRAPSGFGKPVGQGIADRSDRGLKSTPVAFRPKSDHCSAIRTLVSAKPQGPVEPLKIGRNKSMSSDPPLAAGTCFRAWPWKLLSQFMNTLDAYLYKEYQWNPR